MSVLRAATLSRGGTRIVTSPETLAAEVAAGFTVIEVDEVTSEVREALGLQPLHLHGRPPVAQTYDALIAVDQTELVVPVAHGEATDPVYVIATARFLLLVHDGHGVDLDDLAARVSWDAEHLGAVTLYLFVELALRSFRASIREIRDLLDDVEEVMLGRAHRDQLLTLTAVHRRISAMRRALGEYDDAVTDANDVVSTDASFPPALVALAQSHASAVGAVLGTLAVLRDQAANAMDLYRSLAATHQGLVINRLTVISAVLLPLTFITGFYGMNFAWLTDHIAGPAAFWILGVLVPALVVGGVVIAMWRAGWLGVLRAERAGRAQDGRDAAEPPEDGGG